MYTLFHVKNCFNKDQIISEARNHLNTIKYLLTLTKSVIMYASAIWRPIRKINMNRLERIQHKVLRHLAYLSGNPLSSYDHDYTSTAETFCLASVTSSMIASDVIIVYKIKSNHVKCPDLQNLLPIHNSNYVLRNRLPFYPELPSSRHSETNPIFRLSVYVYL